MFNRIVSSIASRLPAQSHAKRGLVTTALWHLQDVAYARLREQGFAPRSIVDIGAYEGRWSRDVREIFPDPPILMVEARDTERDHLAKACEQIGNAKFEIALLSAEPRDANFFISDTGSSLFAERSNADRSQVALKTRTLDSLAASLPAPIFLKIDVQGAELEILRGGGDTLSRAEVVQLEVALLQYNEGAPLAAEVIAYMDAKGFAVFDIAGFIRPNGKDLVQIDAIFVRKDSSLRPVFFTF